MKHFKVFDKEFRLSTLGEIEKTLKELPKSCLMGLTFFHPEEVLILKQNIISWLNTLKDTTKVPAHDLLSLNTISLKRYKNHFFNP